ncbi:uncharacterized protein LOC132263937 [Phlebotomus argentipes]|uniref:uncharacterized protein LOC132263937 n=1 Tax=Phlebotomus argentipes TaxID=94469 RepID=UPI0028933514|nr:uncharacterized protein LOC132263937 [Phlebotomus argentipes]
MFRVNYDENAEVPTGLLPGKGGIQRSEKKKKNALGDVKNTIHHTPMGAAPKTPYHGHVKSIVKTPVNELHNPTGSVVKKSSFVTPGIPMRKSAKRSTKKSVRMAPEMIYNDFPESVYKEDERSLRSIWADNCLTDCDISEIIQNTLSFDPEEEKPPKCHLYEMDELRMPPPSPVDDSGFTFETPPMLPLFDLDFEMSHLELN